ncbi:hypothetical protein DKX38_010120 [Salix brachista]|uniref:Uncharacterized protein n=1 Tax=Salix brachista TaxID=2182728 RepID=A0A5N5MCQ0_9ROSI|nr:hypothetical protein DKX38_010120 [Salix brachista]
MCPIRRSKSFDVRTHHRFPLKVGALVGSQKGPEMHGSRLLSRTEQLMHLISNIREQHNTIASKSNL